LALHVGLAVALSGCVGLPSRAERRLVLEAAVRLAAARGLEVTPHSAAVRWEGDEWSVLFTPPQKEADDSELDLDQTDRGYFVAFVSRAGKTRRLGPADRDKAVRTAKRVAVLRDCKGYAVERTTFDEGEWWVYLDGGPIWDHKDPYAPLGRPSNYGITVRLGAGGVISVHGNR
jgi:hypothetical protein